MLRVVLISTQPTRTPFSSHTPTSNIYVADVTAMCIKLFVERPCKHEELLAWQFCDSSSSECNKSLGKCPVRAFKKRKPYGGFCADCYVMKLAMEARLKAERDEKERRKEEARKAKEEAEAGCKEKVHRNKMKKGGYVIGITELEMAGEWR
jgi:hypothetical protein